MLKASSPGVVSALSDRWPYPLDDGRPRYAPSPRPLRIGDAERDQAAAALGEHFAAGRLRQEEFDTRLAAVYDATYRTDLDPLFADLPSPGPLRPASSAPGGAPTRYRGPRVTAPVVAVLLILLLPMIVAAAAAAHESVVPVVLLGWLGFVVFRRRTWR